MCMWTECFCPGSQKNRSNHKICIGQGMNDYGTFFHISMSEASIFLPYQAVRTTVPVLNSQLQWNPWARHCFVNFKMVYFYCCNFLPSLFSQPKMFSSSTMPMPSICCDSHIVWRWHVSIQAVSISFRQPWSWHHAIIVHHVVHCFRLFYKGKIQYCLWFL